MHHALWPEGQPEKARYFSSYWKARWHLFVEQSKMQIRFWRARRMRWAWCEVFAPDPGYVEYRLYKRKAIPPPGGWSFTDTARYENWDRHLADCDCAWCWLGVSSGDVTVNTYSVL